MFIKFILKNFASTYNQFKIKSVECKFTTLITQCLFHTQTQQVFGYNI